MKNVLIAGVAMLALATIPAMASEATFERTFSVSGQVELSVATGSGNIHISRGGDNQVHIFGKVKANGFGLLLIPAPTEEKIRAIAANPPIEHTGNIIRVGGHHENLHNISIDYEIQAPQNSILEAGSGSGNVTIEGVGENARLSTGSGNIHATGLHGGFSADTGSGNIYAEQTGDGFVKAQTGSGNIELRNLHGGLRGGTGSGNIKAGGTPAADWKLETGSGNIELWPDNNVGILLDASTGSGSIHSDREMLTKGATDKHHTIGKINGGGPTVRVETGSGDIKVH
jgi:hypothetical protein